MEKQSVIYLDCWYKVDYELDENKVVLSFEAYKIISTDDENSSNYETADKSIEGFIKWDECMEIKIEDHFCTQEIAMQLPMLINHIYEQHKLTFE